FSALAASSSERFQSNAPLRLYTSVFPMHYIVLQKNAAIAHGNNGYPSPVSLTALLSLITRP
ncbi:MAG: hypothetical protein AAFP03_06880, partial [Cyanobacteria bacterium J06598_3]